MNSESSSATQGTQTDKPTPKHVHRASRNRPVLVTGNGSSDAQAREEAAQPAVPVTVEEKSPNSESLVRRHVPGVPRFFANIGKTSAPADQPEANPQAARLARAMRGKPVGSAREELVPEKKQTTGTSKTSIAPTRPRSGFKTRYIWGMVIYLLVADVLGVYITNFMQANHLDATLFTWGPVKGTTSTLIFLAILVLILVVMARFDLLPRTFSGIVGGSAQRGKSSSSPSKTKDAPTFETRTPQLTIKQGVQGDHDDLYKEYRENQRYFQRRDRKR
jgi:hypothetical protein